MGEKQDSLCTRRADCDVPLFVHRVRRIVERQCKRIGEHAGRFIERKPVPLDILVGLPGIPFVDDVPFYASAPDPFPIRVQAGFKLAPEGGSASLGIPPVSNRAE